MSLVVFDCVCGRGVLLVVLDCGWDWEVSRRMLCVYQVCVCVCVAGSVPPGFGWEVLCWEVAWRFGGV